MANETENPQYRAPSTPPPAPREPDAAVEPAAAEEKPAEAAPPPPPAPDPVAVVTAERDKFKDGLLRSLAELENFRKRARRDQEDAVRRGREELLRELLPVFDNLERAVQSAVNTTDIGSIARGLDMILRLFEDSLQRVGGRRLRSVGQPFDPQHHEALQQVDSEEHPAGIITAEHLAGYTLAERLVRPAMVVVSRGAPRPAEAPPEPAPLPATPEPEGSGDLH